jgi:Integrase core domain
LSPTDKGVGPLQVWCIDLVSGLLPGSSGQTMMVVCVDVFSKFAVAEAIEDKTSATIANFFNRRIVCEFGCP